MVIGAFPTKVPISARSLSPQDIEKIIEWIVGSRGGRRTAWEQIPGRMGIDIGWWTIRHALRKEGFSRQVARRKTPITPITQCKRLAWVLEHVNWTQSQWNSVLWSDETRVTSGRHTRAWVTWRLGEEYYHLYRREDTTQTRLDGFGDLPWFTKGSLFILGK